MYITENIDEEKKKKIKVGNPVLALGVINIDKIVDASGAKEKDNDYTISLINHSALTPR